MPTTEGRYLIQDYDLSYLSIGRDLLRFNTKTPVKSSKPLVIANPDFDFAKIQTSIELNVSPPLNSLLVSYLILLLAVISCTLLSVHIWIAIIVFFLGLILINCCVIKLKSSYPKRWQQFEEQVQKYAHFFFYPLDPIIWLVLSIILLLSLNIFLVFAIFMLGGLVLIVLYPQQMREFEENIREYKSLPQFVIEKTREQITFPPLPCSQKSGKKIASLLKVQLYQDYQALKSLVSRCQSPRILHIGSHGFFLKNVEEEGVLHQAAKKILYCALV